MGGRRRRSRAEHTDEWEQVELLCGWPEQRKYELIRPLVLFGDPVTERAEETGASERTLYRRTSAFRAEGMESLFGSETTRRRRLPPAMRRLIVDLKAEHPALNLSEISPPASATPASAGAPTRGRSGACSRRNPCPCA
jgi:putative transposase